MPFLHKSMALAAILIQTYSATPYIHIQNSSPGQICYKVEYSNGTGAFPNETDCGATGPEVAGFWFHPGQSQRFDATGFDGAITAVLNNKQTKGARHEINFENSSMPWFDVDYQYGISDGTCGPPSSTNLLGERDTLGKANKAWQNLNQTTKAHLLSFNEYLKADGNGVLTYINMDIKAWPDQAMDVIEFFQVTADFKAYMSPGSVKNVTWPKNSLHQKLVDLANQQALSVMTDQLLITSY